MLVFETCLVLYLPYPKVAPMASAVELLLEVFARFAAPLNCLSTAIASTALLKILQGLYT